MGSAVFASENISVQQESQNSNNIRSENNIDQNYDIDVIQVSNIALAIKHKEHTINVELSLGCQNLPIMKTFGSTDSMIVIYKNNDDNDDEERSFTQIGRTQIVKNDLNPKYIKSFILSFNQQKSEELQFRIYDIIKPKIQDLNQQRLIGKISSKLDILVDNQHTELQIGDMFKKKSKTLLKVSCIEYDGGNSKYQIGLEIPPIIGKTQVLRLNEWIPIARSQSLQIKKNNKFNVMEVPYNKFPSEDNSRIKIKFFQITKSKDQQYIGETDEIKIINIYTNDDKVQNQKVNHNGFPVFSVTVYKWRKVIRDSFISYIVNGAHLNLIVAIDFTNSNSESGRSLHDLTTKPNGQKTNPYIEAIQEIVGVLQYFNYYNQIPLYGFGAKLPPYYKSVGNCFALNGNFFNPTIVGGIQEIIKCYKQNLKKIKLHGPTKLSQILDLAIQYAQSQPQSPNYYVLVILTDGQINDFNDTVDRIVRASTLPLSIVLVGIGDNDFSLFHELDSDASLLRSHRNNEICSRDIVDFIKMVDFKDKNSIVLARQTFAQIPSQFIDYMNKKNIKPNREKKSLKAAKAEFISQKIKQIKKSSEQPIIVIPQFLQYKKKTMKRDLISLGFDVNDPFLDNLNIAMNDLSYFIEVHSQLKEKPQKISNFKVQEIHIRETKKLQQYLERKDIQNKKKTLQKLQKIESNQYGRIIKKVKKKQQIKEKGKQKLQNPCLNCYEKQISVLHLQCGHASLCRICATYKCPLCNYINQELIGFIIKDH